MRHDVQADSVEVVGRDARSARRRAELSGVSGGEGYAARVALQLQVCPRNQDVDCAPADGSRQHGLGDLARRHFRLGRQLRPGRRARAARVRRARAAGGGGPARRRAHRVRGPVWDRSGRGAPQGRRGDAAARGGARAHGEALSPTGPLRRAPRAAQVRRDDQSARPYYGDGERDARAHRADVRDPGARPDRRRRGRPDRHGRRAAGDHRGAHREPTRHHDDQRGEERARLARARKGCGDHVARALPKTVGGAPGREQSARGGRAVRGRDGQRPGAGAQREYAQRGAQRAVGVARRGAARRSGQRAAARTRGRRRAPRPGGRADRARGGGGGGRRNGRGRGRRDGGRRGRGGGRGGERGERRRG